MSIMAKHLLAGVSRRRRGTPKRLHALQAMGLHHVPSIGRVDGSRVEV